MVEIHVLSSQESKVCFFSLPLTPAFILPSFLFPVNQEESESSTSKASSTSTPGK